MSESIGLTKKELEEIQNELKSSLDEQIQKLIKEIQEQSIGEGVDIVSMMAGKDSIALTSAIEFTQKAIEANNRKIADIMTTRDTLVLQTSIEFAQKAIEANNKKIFEYIEEKFKFNYFIRE
ncbi:hypothetical protein EON78_01100 [bacterium]|nr:MAG: hypothetical protein EON78_01100 [bacterium]